MAKKIIETPLMKQYIEMKKKHPDAVLLFRVGDFYETFSDDAITASRILGITLTRRANGAASSVELAGFPHHALDSYLPKLVRAGKRVAICEQLEDPKTAKGLVKRGITELVTPGVNLSPGAMASRENNFLAGVCFGKKATGVAFLDISTGEFLCASGDTRYIGKLIANIAPRELLTMRGTKADCTQFPHRCPIFELDEWVYSADSARERLLRQFATHSLKGFGVEQWPEAVIAAGSLLYYLDQTCHTARGHITTLGRIDESRFVHLDNFTIRNLELLESQTQEGLSLIKVLDRTATPMGSRLLRNWLLFPLLDIERIRQRHDAVEFFFKVPELRDSLLELLGKGGDMDRLVSKAATQRIGPRDMLQLASALHISSRVKKMLSGCGCPPLEKLAESIDPCDELADTIEATISADAPMLASKGGVIAPGVDSELDELRALASGSRDALAEICSRESAATGIPSLKISFNNVFGYYIEVRNTHRDKVPQNWIRKQTLVNAERYITPELKDYEQRIMGAESSIADIEARIYTSLVESCSQYLAKIREASAAIARIDVLLDLAIAARDYHYTRPEVNDTLRLEITAGRHPVIERRLPPGETYVANSLTLDSDAEQIMMITGPNMSGKSALLRQTALIALMAQAGSFVPAESARIGIVDKIFTRVGASDNLSMGESTFMVEMSEAASILNNMSARSLILFDELGRGTSTYDGISIAWAIVEHIHENGRFRPRTLFATHYHELNEMEKTFRRVANYNVSVQESNGKVVFMRKLVRGGSAHSFGIHVAGLAGVPRSVVKRADEVLRELESGREGSNSVSKADVSGIGKNREGYQLSIFQLDDPLLSQIRDRLIDLDIDNLTPLQALNMLHDLRNLITG